MQIEGLVGAAKRADGDKPALRQGYSGEVMTGAMNGFFAEQVSRGNGYVFSSALAGVALIAATTSANKMLIVNPPNSGRVLTLIQTRFGRTAVGTPLEGSVVYNKGLARSISISSGAGNDIVSYTAVAAVNLRSDLGDNSGMLFAPATSVVTTAPSLWAAAGLAQTADNGATTVMGPHMEQARDDIWGALQLYPGTYFTVGAAVSISTTYTVSVLALSLPVPSQA